MRKAILYIAMSLDGYIADARGGVDWLTGDGSEPEHEGSYPAFYNAVDTVIMGHTTYRQITCELSPGHWVYGDKNAMSSRIRACPLPKKRSLPHRTRLRC